ncbi:MAG: hypothetical protein ACP5EN_04545 [Rhodovulum sp.]
MIRIPVLPLLVAAALPATAQVPDMPILPEGWDIPNIAPLPEGQRAEDPATLSISGAWIYSTSNHTLLACDFPASPGEPMSGHMEIAEHDGGVTVTLVTGGRCDPASMCIFEGGIAGNILAVANSGTVDGEGGVAANGWAVIFTGTASGTGSGTSSYVHPKGYRCAWSYRVDLRRPAEGELD